jgi:hypothetical protein
VTGTSGVSTVKTYEKLNGGKNMRKFNQLSNEELKFVATTTAKDVNEFSQGYIKTFGIPKNILRLQTLWYGRKKYAKKYAEMTKVVPKTKKIVKPLVKKTVGAAFPDEGLELVKIYDRLGVIEYVLKEINHNMVKQLQIYEALLNKKKEAETQKR